MLLTGTIRIIGHSAHFGRARANSDARRLAAAPRSRLALALLLARRRILGSARSRRPAGVRAWIVLLPPKPQVPSRRVRGHGHRCRTGRLAAADHAGRQDAAARFGRHDRARRAPTSMLARRWSRLTFGPAEFAGWMPWRFRTRTAITWAACAASSRIFSRASFWYGVESPDPGFVEVEETARSSTGAAETLDSWGIVRLRRRSRSGVESATGWQPSDPAQDDESLVLHMQYGETSALLVGDAHKRIEKFLIDESPQADLLKVGHHGSATSSSPEFLAAVKPRYSRWFRWDSTTRSDIPGRR